MVKIYRGYLCNCFKCSNDITPEKMKAIDGNKVTLKDAPFTMNYMQSKQLTFSSWTNIFTQLSANLKYFLADEKNYPKYLTKRMDMNLEDNQRIMKCIASLVSFPCLRENNCFIDESNNRASTVFLLPPI